MLIGNSTDGFFVIFRSSRSPIFVEFDAAESWIIRATLVEVWGRARAEAAHDVRVEQGGDVRVMAIDFHTVANVHITPLIFLTIVVKRSVDWSSILGDSQH